VGSTEAGWVFGNTACVYGTKVVYVALLLLQVMKMLAESGPELLAELRAAEAAYNRSALVRTSATCVCASVTPTYHSYTGQNVPPSISSVA
jgi:hypothetical protein